jgi:hypothetical protein
MYLTLSVVFETFAEEIESMLRVMKTMQIADRRMRILELWMNKKKKE